MSARSLLPLLLFLCGSTAAICGTACSSMSPAAAQTPASAGEAHDEKPVLTGYVSREQVEAAVPDWVQAEVESTPDPAAVQALVALTAGTPGADVTIYLGTWCGDSRRELARLWRAMDDCGGVAPFAVEYIAVDRTKKEPADLVDGSGLLYVPTLIVRRNGREVGRIVEQSPNGIERDLVSLLDGSARGLLTAKPELLPEKQP